MNEMIKIMQERIDELSDQLSDIKKHITSTEIDHQLFIKSNPVIPPGIACKIAYDKYGLIINGESLTSSDIPEIPIQKVTGLQSIIDRIEESISSNTIVSEVVKKNTEIKGTGIKVNYDEDGHIISSSFLTIDDIPSLAIEKIEGLKDQLDYFKSIYDKKDEEEVFTVSPGTFSKITYDSHGRVLGGSSLSLNDIPSELITRINKIESMIPTMANNKVVENISKLMNDKIDSNKPITPGVYTKVRVDSKGLIINGNSLTVDDIPQLPITIINDLDTILGKKALQVDVDELNQTVSKLVSMITKVNEINTLKDMINKKANESDMKSIIMKVDEMTSLFSELQSKIPNELILDQLQQIQNELSVLSGRISVLERKVSQ